MWSQGRSQGYANVGEKWQRSLADVLEVWDGEKYVTILKNEDIRDITEAFMSITMSSDYVMTEDESHKYVLYLSGIGANRNLTLYTATGVGEKSYRLILDPQATSGGPFTLTVKSSIGSTDTVVIPIIPSSHTLESGTLNVQVHVDASGNVSSGAFVVSGSSSDGEYERTSSGDQKCHKSVSVTEVVATALGSLFGDAASVSAGSWPAAFQATPDASFSLITSPFFVWLSQTAGVSTSAAGSFRITSYTSRASATYVVSVIGIGRWR